MRIGSLFSGGKGAGLKPGTRRGNGVVPQQAEAAIRDALGGAW